MEGQEHGTPSAWEATSAAKKPGIVVGSVGHALKACPDTNPFRVSVRSRVSVAQRRNPAKYGTPESRAFSTNGGGLRGQSRRGWEPGSLEIESYVYQGDHDGHFD